MENLVDAVERLLHESRIPDVAGEQFHVPVQIVRSAGAAVNLRRQRIESANRVAVREQ